MKIPITPCASSQLTGHGYDAATETLALQFRGGAIYHYRGVPAVLYDEFVAADSKGAFLNQRVKGVFDFTKQPAEDSNGQC